MTRQDATELMQGFFRTHQRESRGLNAHGLGVVMMGATPMTFEYRETEQALWCHGLVYRFTNPLRPEVLRALEQLQADPGGAGEQDAAAARRALKHVYARFSEGFETADLRRPRAARKPR